MPLVSIIRKCSRNDERTALVDDTSKQTRSKRLIALGDTTSQRVEERVMPKLWNGTKTE